jgi:surface polysaccharide O-acyltransferase-like enzyme
VEPIKVYQVLACLLVVFVSSIAISTASASDFSSAEWLVNGGKLTGGFRDLTGWRTESY